MQTKYYVNRHTELIAAGCVRMVLQVIYTEMSSARVHERGLMFKVFFKPIEEDINVVGMWKIFRKCNYYNAPTFLNHLGHCSVHMHN